MFIAQLAVLLSNMRELVQREQGPAFFTNVVARRKERSKHSRQDEPSGPQKSPRTGITSAPARLQPGGEGHRSRKRRGVAKRDAEAVARRERRVDHVATLEPVGSSCLPCYFSGSHRNRMVPVLSRFGVEMMACLSGASSPRLSCCSWHVKAELFCHWPK
jgi:hypothetical protein